VNLITLTSDFGLKDPFVGMMKGVILSVNNEASLIDISHGIDSQDIFSAAFIINNSFKYFPKKTIHLVVVDPGVGSNRRPILVKASDHYFIGPDNGVLSFVIAGDNNEITMLWYMRLQKRDISSEALAIRFMDGTSSHLWPDGYPGVVNLTNSVK